MVLGRFVEQVSTVPCINLSYRFILNVIKIIETKIHKQNNLHLKCFPGFMELLEYLVFVEFPRFLFFFWGGGGGGGRLWVFFFRFEFFVNFFEKKFIK